MSDTNKQTFVIDIPPNLLKRIDDYTTRYEYSYTNIFNSIAKSAILFSSIFFIISASLYLLRH